MPLVPPFAARESRVDSAVFRHLANVSVSINGADEVLGVFTDPAAMGNVGRLGMATTQPSVLVPASAVPVDVEGLAIVVNGVAYVVAVAEAETADSTLLTLERP